MFWQSVEQSIAKATGHPFAIKQKSALSGGSINAAFRITGENGRSYFVKRNDEQGLDMFEAEADGLRELAQSRAIRVPVPVCSGATAGNAWLVTEYIAFGRQSGTSSYLLGQQLATLHGTRTDQFGWFRDNTIGLTPQHNGKSDNWISFFRAHRLKFQFDLAAQNGFGGTLQHKGDRLLVDLDQFFDSYTPMPSLLHGDLWGGNRGFDEQGTPVLFDPAVYYGDREADMAMTELFGGFGSTFYDAYNEVWPLDDGYQVRKTLYNLYHILNHANLFGGGYATQAESMIDGLLSEIE